MSDWMIALIEDGGYVAIAGLMFLENVFPPLPSEIVMPLAGYVAQTGAANIWLTIIAGALGSLAGTLIWYWIGWALGVERLSRFAEKHGRWIAMTADDVERANRWFDKYGAWAVAFGRVLPVIRTLISVPAGVYAMPIWRFTVYTTIGVFLWTGMLAAAGWRFGAAYGDVDEYVGPLSSAVVVFLVAWQGYRMWRAR